MKMNDLMDKATPTVHDCTFSNVIIIIMIIEFCDISVLIIITFKFHGVLHLQEIFPELVQICGR